MTSKRPTLLSELLIKGRATALDRLAAERAEREAQAAEDKAERLRQKAIGKGSDSEGKGSDIAVAALERSLTRLVNSNVQSFATMMAESQTYTTYASHILKHARTLADAAYKTCCNIAITEGGAIDRDARALGKTLQAPKPTFPETTLDEKGTELWMSKTHKAHPIDRASLSAVELSILATFEAATFYNKGTITMGAVTSTPSKPTPAKVTPSKAGPYRKPTSAGKAAAGPTLDDSGSESDASTSSDDGGDPIANLVRQNTLHPLTLARRKRKADADAEPDSSGSKRTKTQ